jgi:hypothetical protein
MADITQENHLGPFAQFKMSIGGEMEQELIAGIPEKVKQLYAIVKELEAMFPGRHFTLDGHLIGSVGEVLAAYHYGLELLPASYQTHDAVSLDGRRIQIKATQVNRIGISSEPDCLLVLKILPDGRVEEIYNGPGKNVWEAAGKRQKNGQRYIPNGQLRKLSCCVKPEEKLPMLRG